MKPTFLRTVWLAGWKFCVHPQIHLSDWVAQATLELK